MLPTLNPDGSITAVVTDAGAATLRLSLPGTVDAGGAGNAAGRFLLARCAPADDAARLDDWQVLLRRALFPVATRRAPDDTALWEVLLPPADDPGGRRLRRLRPGDALHLLGPLGTGFALHAHSRALLLLGDAARVPALLPLADAMLDRGGRVTLVVRLGKNAAPDDVQALAARLPLAVELRPATSADWTDALAATARWADQVCLALPNGDLPTALYALRRARLRVDEGYAQALVEADLACGYGACLACAVPLARGGLTRACVHGPVFDLLRLA
jgi:dihydroorotate dehydrogenase electron transfer subunit